jgi:DNA polymerase theta
VRKFTWNLKVQIQVLKKPSVSTQRFGSLDKLDKNMDLEVVDNSYLLLPPIHVKDAIDMCIVAWILWPDEESSSSPNLDKVPQIVVSYAYIGIHYTHMHIFFGVNL